MDKKILTWTTLCEMACSLSRRSPGDYRDLVTGGTDKFIPGHYVRVLYGREFQIFRGPSSASNTMMSITGVYSDTGYFTKFRHKITPTSYKKRFWDRYMPVSFVSGLPLRGATASCWFHSTSGDKQNGTLKFREWRGESGHFSVHPESPQYLMVNDTTGKVVHICEKGRVAPDAGPAVEVYQYSPEECNGGDRAFPWYRIATLHDTCQGVPDGATASRDEWLRSIWKACEAGLMDKYKCLPLAARMWNSAYKFCHANKHRHARLVAYPLLPSESDNKTVHGCKVVLGWKNANTAVVNGENEAYPLNLVNVPSYRLPQLEVRWEGERDYDTPRNSPTNVVTTKQDPRFITMALPPHGNPLLYDRPHWAAPHVRTAKAVSRMNGEHINVGDKDVSVTSKEEYIVRFLERAYHGARIWDPSRLGDVTGHHSRSRYYNANETWESAGDSVVDAKWRDYPDCVIVKSNFDESPTGKDGPWCEYTGGDIGLPATPESAVAMVEEASLLDSLPLS